MEVDVDCKQVDVRDSYIDEQGDEVDKDEAEVEEEGPLAETVEADCLMGLMSEDIEACDQPLPTLAEGQEEARELARSSREMIACLR